MKLTQFPLQHKGPRRQIDCDLSAEERSNVRIAAELRRETIREYVSRAIRDALKRDME